LRTPLLLLGALAFLAAPVQAQSAQSAAPESVPAYLGDLLRTPQAPPASALAPCTAGEEVAQNTATAAYSNGHGVTTTGGNQELGQSFTAPCTGALDSLIIVFQPRAGTAGQPATVRLSVFAGEGTGGVLLDSQTVSFAIPAEGSAYTLGFDFSTVPVLETTAYTFFVDMLEGAINVHGANTNPYPGGVTYVSASGDPSGATAVDAIDLRFFAVFGVTIPVASAGGPGSGALALATAAPNPVADRAAIAFEVREAADVRLAVYDALGREVAVLADGPFAAGQYEAAFDASRLSAGTYVVRLQAAGEVLTSRVAVAR
jgi:hypothetical protein